MRLLSLLLATLGGSVFVYLARRSTGLVQERGQKAPPSASIDNMETWEGFCERMRRRSRPDLCGPADGGGRYVMYPKSLGRAGRYFCEVRGGI